MTKLESSGQPSFDLQLQAFWGAYSILDLNVSFDADATVDEMASAIRLYAAKDAVEAGEQLEELAPDFGICVTVRHRSTSTDHETLVLLPATALLSNCNLTNGMRLTLKPVLEDLVEARVDPQLDDAELYVTDLVSPNKGRITALRPMRRLAVGSNLNLDDDAIWPLVVDDLRAAPLAFHVETQAAGGQALAWVQPVEGVRLFLNGRQGHVSKDYAEFRRASASALPRLVVIFDEFATLAEGPRSQVVMKKVVDVAQRGRSVGVHLVLATQHEPLRDY